MGKIKERRRFRKLRRPPRENRFAFEYTRRAAQMQAFRRFFCGNGVENAESGRSPKNLAKMENFPISFLAFDEKRE